MTRVFSQKHSSTSVSNVGIYSVGIESVCQKWQFGKIECFTSVSREGLTRELLMKHSCLHLVLTLRIPIKCRSHASFHGMLSRELLAKTLQSSIFLESHTLSLSHTILTIKSHIKYMVQKIEHNYNQIWHGIKANKTHSCKLHLYKVIERKDIKGSKPLWFLPKYVIL